MIILTTTLSIISFAIGFLFCHWLMKERIVSSMDNKIVINIEADVSGAVEEIERLTEMIKEVKVEMITLPKK